MTTIKIAQRKKVLQRIQIRYKVYLQYQYQKEKKLHLPGGLLISSKENKYDYSQDSQMHKAKDCKF